MMSASIDNDTLYGLYIIVAKLQEINTSVNDRLGIEGIIGANNSARSVIETNG